MTNKSFSGSGGYNPHFKKTTHSQRSYQGHGQLRLRKNERIRAVQVRVIGADGKQIGVLQTTEALRLAKQQGLDLIEVSAGATPPVCRIADFGKYMYEESKKQKSQKTPATKLKEIKFRLNIDEHDYITKIRQSEVFLGKGYRLKIVLFFKGRELEHKDFGFKIINRVISDLSQVATPDGTPRLIGKNIGLTFTPLPASRRKLKFNEPNESEEVEGQESGQ